MRRLATGDDVEENATLGVIVRFHNMDRIEELSRCVFSLVCQNYSPIQIIICTQRFSQEQIVLLQKRLGPIVQISADSASLQISNYTGKVRDARAVLLNLGFENSVGRYVAFLDYDDVIFPNGYSLLIDELTDSDAAIAFGGIEVKRVNMSENCLISISKEVPFKGSNLLDLFRENFCPIHSFVLDRSKIDPEMLYFEPSLVRCEDYDLLLRLCATYPCSFEFRNTIIGQYYYKDDESNTNLVMNSDPENRIAWETARSFLDQRRRMIFVSAEVQKKLGISDPNPDLTIRDLII
jgi:hypothetical protein